MQRITLALRDMHREGQLTIFVWTNSVCYPGGTLELRTVQGLFKPDIENGCWSFAKVLEIGG